MEEVVSSHSQKQNLQPVARRNSSSGTKKDLWLVVREGSVADVDLALALLKKGGGNINSRNVFGLTPLHVAIWRNHIPIVKRLLAAGADPNARVCYVFGPLDPLNVFVTCIHAVEVAFH